MDRTIETEAYRNELNLGDVFDTQSFDSVAPIAAQWRWLYEIETSAGPMIVKIPMFDDQVQQFIAACTAGAK